MNPEFGTVIWNLLFEPLTGELQELIIEDISKVVKYDPRLAVGNVVLSEYEHGLAVNIELTYIPEDLTDVLYLQFNKNSGTIATGKIA